METAFEPVIGLEVHCQLATETKIFCGCPARVPEGQSVSDLEPNSRVCPVCAGHPGTLPVLNERVLEYAVKAGLALGCEIRLDSVFARKNYFYPDLPKGYQISQYDRPICENGALEIQTSSGFKKISIQRIHMEEDAGKTVHQSGYSLVNLNRAGVPLIEIVSAPDIRSPEEAGAYLRLLHGIVVSLGVTDGNMEEGNFRCDANVSVRPKGQTTLGTRAEIKNVNSFRFVEKAIEFEIRRQIERIKAGERIIQETRGYDSGKNQTYSMRSKETAEDYRYFADPDLIRLQLSKSWVEKVRSELPELPEQKKKRYRDLGISEGVAQQISTDPELSAFFSHTMDCAQRLAPQFTRAQVAPHAANLLAVEVARLLKLETLDESNDLKTRGLQNAHLKPEHLAEIVKLLLDSQLASQNAKIVLAEIWQSGGSVASIVEAKGLRQESDLGALDEAVRKVIDANPGPVAEFKAGKEKLIGFFVGQVMKSTGGKANPALVQELVRKRILG